MTAKKPGALSLQAAAPGPPPPCLRCLAVVLLILAAVGASFAYLAIDYRALGSAGSLRLMGRFVAEFFPPDLSGGFLSRVGWGALQTLAVSALGSLLAAGA
ncbi:MAG: phosphonate transporter, inner rane subunit, partial [Variovorax sp.]|nr:phosphonate transporter, inner rane subunit [Variovorax sp.]